jgi:hypothetical protein
MKFGGEGPWELPLAGFEVGRLTFGLPIDLYLYGDDGPARLQLPGPFEFEAPGSGVRNLDPEIDTWEEMCELLVLRQDRVSRAMAWKDARLRVDFSSGRVIRAHSTDRYESWEISGKGYKIVGTHGEVAIWDEDSQRVVVSPRFGPEPGTPP